MPQPTRTQVHVNRLLTSISIAYLQDLDNALATWLFPNVPVQKQSDRYLQYIKADWFRIQARKRAPSTESVGSGWNLDNSATYFADVFALHKDIDDQIRGNSDEMINMDRDATEWLTQQMALKRELEFQIGFMAAGLWGTTLTGVAAAPGGGQFLQWNDASSTPIEDIRAQVIAIAQRTGRRPNRFAVNPFVWGELVDHPLVLDRIKYSQLGVVGEDLLASVLGVTGMRVGWLSQNTLEESVSPTVTEGTFSFIVPKAALLVYAADRPSLLQPSGGYTFAWNGLLGAGAEGQRIMTFREERIHSDRVEAEMAFDMKIVGADLGTYFDAAVA